MDCEHLICFFCLYDFDIDGFVEYLCKDFIIERCCRWTFDFVEEWDGVGRVDNVRVRDGW